jgi:hypothetical protein
MANPLQFGRKKNQGAGLDPALKEFLDEVLIPTLVQKYLRDHDNQLAVVSEDVPEFAVQDPASAEGVP